MSRLTRSAAYRVAIVYSAAFALAMVVLGLVLYFAFYRELLIQLDDRLGDEISDLAADYTDGGIAELIRAIDEREQPAVAGEIGYALFNASGQRIAGHMDTTLPAPGKKTIIFNDPVEGPDPARAEIRSLAKGLTLVVAADLAPVERIDRMMISLLLSALGAVLAIGLAGGLLLGGYLRKRLAGISGAAQAIMAGDLAQRMAISRRDDEFDRLATTLNAMLDRIAALMDNLGQVSSDLAHDLRTPLSRLRARLEAALCDNTNPPTLRAGTEAALVQVDEILSLFSAILRISEIESGRLKRSFALFDFSVLVEDLCESFAPAIEDHGRFLRWFVAPGIAFNGDRDLIAQAIVNLIENAQKHTSLGTEIRVELVQMDSDILLIVADNGPGVAAADRSRITGRFIRLEAARSTPGNGLGLNLVAAIAALHHAALQLGDNRPGLVVTLHFPSVEAS